MATPLSATRFTQLLTSSGVSYRAREGWASHNRGQRGDGWGITEANPTGVHGIMIHHTGPYQTSAGIISLLWSGYKGLPGPLCHAGVDKSGTHHLVGWGRTNHAGTGDPRVLEHVVAEDYSALLPKPRYADGEAGGVDGNARFYGFELLNQGDGKDPWPEAQLAAVARSCAAVCRAHGWSERSVIGHKEWQRGKIDPTFSMPDFRLRVRAELEYLRKK